MMTADITSAPRYGGEGSYEWFKAKQMEVLDELGEPIPERFEPVEAFTHYLIERRRQATSGNPETLTALHNVHGTDFNPVRYIGRDDATSSMRSYIDPTGYPYEPLTIN